MILEKLCWDADWEFDESALVAMARLLLHCGGELRDQAKLQAMQTLKQLCEDENSEFPQIAAEALGHLLPHLADELKEPAQIFVVQTLEQLCGNDIDPEVRTASLETLGQLLSHLDGELKDQAKSLVVQTLKRLCRDGESVYIRTKALDSLGRLASHLAPELKDQAKSFPIHTLTQLCRDEDLLVRAAAAEALGQWMPYLEGKERDRSLNLAVQTLLQLCGNEQLPHVRKVAAKAWGQWSPSFVGELKEQDQILVVQTLNKLFGNNDWEVGLPALESLGRLLPHLSSTLKEQTNSFVLRNLEELSADKVWVYRKDAAEVLQRLAPHLAGEWKDQVQTFPVRNLERLCGDKDSMVRAAAAEALGQWASHLVGESREQDQILAVQTLQRLCGDKNPEFHQVAARSLRQLAEQFPEIRERINADLAGGIAKFKQLLNASSDSASRVGLFGAGQQDILENLEILQQLLGFEAKTELPAGPNFDPTLSTAHRLLDQLIQALAINRFALLSGPPASGKSEVGRYLGATLDWGTVIFNGHRFTSEEDLMQKIGVVTNGVTSFKIVDGPLAEALLQGKLFIWNEINLPKPGNLSFLFSVLADFSEEFDYYNAETGQTEKRKIHPNFRMIGTQNPDGPGRKELNAALKNRAVEIHAPAYSDLELATLLRGRNPELGELATTLVRLYRDLSFKMESRAIGGESEGYAWNFRHLMRMAEGFSNVKEEISAPEILSVLYDMVGASLGPQDRGIFFDAIRNYEYQGSKISAADVKSFVEGWNDLTLRKVLEELNIDPKTGALLADQSGISDLPTSNRFLRTILKSLQEGYNPWLKGPAGTGKSKLANFAATLLGGKVYDDTLTPQTDESKLKGELKPTQLTQADGSKKLGFKNVPSALVKALQDSDSKLAVCILDEAGFAKPDVLEELNSLLDRDGGIWVVDEKGESQFLKRKENFRLILASNTYGYSGVNLQSEALRSRTQEIFMDFEFKAEELDAILGVPRMRRSGGGSGNANPISPEGQTSPATPKLKFPSPAPKQGPLSLFRPVSAFTFNTFDNPVRDKIRGSALEKALSPELIRKLEARYAEVERRLLGAAAASGRTGDLRIEFDPNTETASLSLTEPRVFRIGAQVLLDHGVEDLLTIAQHEGGHAEISRVGSGFFFKNEKLRALLNAVEDLRVNARAMERVPGRAELYRDFLRRYYGEFPEEMSSKKFPQLFPHEAFLQAVLSKSYGDAGPWESDPRVVQALQKAMPLIQRAVESRPNEDAPDETSVQQHFSKFEKILQEDILPIYEGLYRESLQQAEAALKWGSISLSGGSGGQDSTIDPKDLSEAARKLLEGRAKQFADALAPKGSLGERQKQARASYNESRSSRDSVPPPRVTDQKPGSLGEFLDQRHQDWRRLQKNLIGKSYSKALTPLGKLPELVFQIFDKLLKPNTDFEFEGHFTSGPRIDVARAIKAIHGLMTQLKVFERKTEPTAKDYRFSLLLDASGSMADRGPRERGGLGLAALFTDVFERLQLPYSLDVFHDSFLKVKGFDQSLKTPSECNQLFNHLVLNSWGQGGTNLRTGIRGSLEKIRTERQRDPRDIEFLFVLTDGEETHNEGADIRSLCEEAAREGILVVGIGIGEGMQTVRQEFPIHLVEARAERLPHLLAEFIKEYARSLNEEE